MDAFREILSALHGAEAVDAYLAAEAADRAAADAAREAADLAAFRAAVAADPALFFTYGL